jgi:phenylalanyl-tRNA synthetase alpha chain
MQTIDIILAQSLQELDQIKDLARLEDWRIRYLGKSGVVKEIFGQIGSQPSAGRPEFARKAQNLKSELERIFQGKRELLKVSGAPGAPAFDVTLPGRARRLGREHLISQTADELCEIFGRMGFDIATGPEVEDEFHNFQALNIPPAHPARDPLDSFYLSVDPVRLLRSQTSTVQIRVMETQPPPVRVVAPGRTYRPDTGDATHSDAMFHQIEGLYVDQGVSMVDLKTCLNQFIHAYYGPTVQTRFRPSFFPFTEPSAELDILWSPDPARPPRWMELGGCGMVDPAVFEAVGYDAEKYTGFAFGFGIERTLMPKYRLPDIRLLYEGDVRFLEQW